MPYEPKHLSVEQFKNIITTLDSEDSLLEAALIGYAMENDKLKENAISEVVRQNRCVIAYEKDGKTGVIIATSSKAGSPVGHSEREAIKLLFNKLELGSFPKRANILNNGLNSYHRAHEQSIKDREFVKEKLSSVKLVLFTERSPCKVECKNYSVGCDQYLKEILDEAHHHVYFAVPHEQANSELLQKFITETMPVVKKVAQSKQAQTESDSTLAAHCINVEAVDKVFQKNDDGSASDLMPSSILPEPSLKKEKILSEKDGNDCYPRYIDLCDSDDDENTDEIMHSSIPCEINVKPKKREIIDLVNCEKSNYTIILDDTDFTTTNPLGKRDKTRNTDHSDQSKKIKPNSTHGQVSLLLKKQKDLTSGANKTAIMIETDLPYPIKSNPDRRLPSRQVTLKKKEIPSKPRNQLSTKTDIKSAIYPNMSLSTTIKPKNKSEVQPVVEDSTQPGHQFFRK